MRWHLRKVRVANIPQPVRDELERAGETVIAAALAIPMDVPSSPYHKFRNEEKTAAEAWLTEHRDLAERKAQCERRWLIAAAVFAGLAVVVSLLAWLCPIR
jgi:hypothetical protein